MRRPPVLLPNWYHSSHPLHLSPSVRRRILREFDPRGIFLNIPYSPRYTKLEVAILSTVTAYGLAPRMAKEQVGLEIRLQKIARMALSCGYGLTDLSYVGRMNMPLELGLLLAWGRETFVMSTRPYENLRTISDLNFADIHFHRGSVKRLIHGLSRWVEQQCSSKRLRATTLLKRYRQWQEIRRSLGSDFDRLQPHEIAKMVGIAEDEFSIHLSASN